jgi:presenilin-like A22 family membrane protease
MAEHGEVREGYRIEHPNREKAASKATKATVVLLLLVTVVLMVVITIGGWDALQGAKAVQIAYPILFLFFALLIARWNRGLLPVTAALSIILLIFAAVSVGAWFDRDKTGFTDPALDADVLGMLTFILVPVQVLLIAFAMRGFAQAWNVEVERPVDEPRDSGRTRGRQPQPA